MSSHRSLGKLRSVGGFSEMESSAGRFAIFELVAQSHC
jgi:hypothetical protein